jgi:hypothetical protein
LADTYPIESQLVISTSGQLIPGGKVYVYDSDDIGNTTPLELADPNGLPIANPITASPISTTPEIRAPLALVKMVGENGAQLTVLSAKGVVEQLAALKQFIETIGVGGAVAGDTAGATFDTATGEFFFTLPKGEPGPVDFRSIARNPDLIITGAVTRDANGAATSAPVTWPDSTPGTYTATALSTAFPGAVDGYQITYGSPATRTYTQPTITRDSTGAAINVPAITVS